VVCRTLFIRKRNQIRVRVTCGSTPCTRIRIREMERKYNQSEKGKARRRRWADKYYKSEKGKALLKIYHQRRNEKNKKERKGGNKNNDA